jgi:O-acetyl-ADP-ribose deacetylase (regulator of RNase III)
LIIWWRNKKELTFFEGYLLEQKIDVIAHQVNCLGVMGAGVAAQIRDKYPEVYKAYKDFCRNELDRLDTLQTKYLLGNCFVCASGNKNPVIANLFGQDRCDLTGRMTNYDAVYDALTGLREIMESRGLKSVAFPYGMSSGLGGGSWDIIYAMIVDVFGKSDISIKIVSLESYLGASKDGV